MISRPNFDGQMSNLRIRKSYPYPSSEWFLTGPFQMVYGAWGVVVTRMLGYKKSLDLKSLQANVLEVWQG